MITAGATVPQQAVGAWSTSEIHDTVAAIARLPEYATPLRRSLLGRAFGFLIERLADVLDFFRGSRDVRIAAIAAVALILLAVVGRIVVARRLDVANARSRLGSTIGRGERRDFWAHSRELAADGDYMGAAHALYAAVIDALTRSGAIRFHSSKTSGDYTRELRRRGFPALQEFRAFAREFDRAVYGTVSLDDQTYTDLVRLAEQVSSARTAA